MKILLLVVRVVLGLIFLVFGLNGFLNFLHAPMPGGVAGEYFHAIFVSHYLYLICGTQALAGTLLLLDQFSALALALLAPVIANILTFHLTMQRQGLPLAIVVLLLWLALALRHRAAFARLFIRKA